MKKVILILVFGSLFGDTIKYSKSIFLESTKDNVEYLGISKNRVYYLNNINGRVESMSCSIVIEIFKTPNESIEYDCQAPNYEPIELPPKIFKEKIGINSIVFGTTEFGRSFYQINKNSDLEKLLESYMSYYIGIGMTQRDKSIIELYFIMTNIRVLYMSNSGYSQGYYREYKIVGIDDSKKGIGISYSKPMLKNMYLTLGLNIIPRQKSYPSLSEDEIRSGTSSSRWNIKFVPKPFIGFRFYVPIGKKLVLPIGINYYLPTINWFAGGLPGEGRYQYYNYLSISSGIKLNTARLKQ
tara:strand:- start:76 stop:966 length:891 start_codon:yes stop_codon:yes gene_type:complete